MVSLGFDNEKYIKLQSDSIKERVEKFGDKLYLELGGKLFDDYHASRVLPGFEPDSKIKMLLELKDKLEIVIAISAVDIEKNKVRSDYNLTYDLDTLRLIETFTNLGLYVGSVVITKYNGQKSADSFKVKLQNLGIKVFNLRWLDGYPANIDYIVSDDGFGSTEYVETTRPIVVVAAPGPGSGKMAVCLSQLYHESKRGVKVGYAKFETFPIWNLPLNHPVNLAYEAATADFNDVNMIDPFHLDKYGESAVNYNRDIEVFPVLNAIFNRLLGESPYYSPTDMGVNMAGNCIIDDDIVSRACKDEIIRRYYQALKDKLNGRIDENCVYKLELIMQKVGANISQRYVVSSALLKSAITGCPACALKLHNGSIVTGRETSLLCASSAVFLNALKELANIPDNIHLISPDVIEPLQSLKTNHLGCLNCRLQLEETLIALSISAVSDENAKLALECLTQLRGTEVHSSVVLSTADETTFKKLGVNLTSEAKFR